MKPSLLNSSIIFLISLLTFHPIFAPGSLAARGGFIDSGQAFGSFRSKDVALGDVDGDGDLDAFIANAWESINFNMLFLYIPSFPDIKANGQDEVVLVTPQDTVGFTISLDPGEMTGQLCDWWIVICNPPDRPGPDCISHLSWSNTFV
jgi:hypothetical protein